MISVLVALAIGTAELLQVIANELGFTSLIWDWVNGVDFVTIGFDIIVIFLISWLVSVAI